MICIFHVKKDTCQVFRHAVSGIFYRPKQATCNSNLYLSIYI